jgi:hypothetical protein
VFIEILGTRSRDQIEAIKMAYADRTGHSLEKAIDSEVSGHFKHALLTIGKPKKENKFLFRLCPCCVYFYLREMQSLEMQNIMPSEFTKLWKVLERTTTH